jgi:hypothetical protein
MNKWLSSVALLLVAGVSASEAQFSPAPIINPGMRSGTGPSFTPYGAGFGSYGGFGGYGGYGSPYGGAFGPSAYGGLYGQTMGGYGGFGPGGNMGFGTNLAGAGVITPYAATGLVLPQSANVTGHPTRFNAYSQYFNNQGTGLLSNALISTPSQVNTPAGLNARINSGTGSAPQGPQGQQGQPQPVQP